MPKNTKDRHKAAYLPYRCDEGTYELICKIAAEKRIPKVEVLRSFVADGMAKQGYKQDEDFLLKMIRQAVREELKPSVERLASISAKGTQISSADFFLLVYLGRLLVPDEDALEAVAAQSRQLGIEYLKLAKDRDLDDFLRRGIARVNDNNSFNEGVPND